MHMLMGMRMFGRRLPRRPRQRRQDAAVFAGLDVLALGPQRLQFLLQALELLNALGDMVDVCVQQRVDGAAVGLRCILEPEQQADRSSSFDLTGWLDSFTAAAAQLLRLAAYAALAYGLVVALRFLLERWRERDARSAQASSAPPPQTLRAHHRAIRR